MIKSLKLRQLIKNLTNLKYSQNTFNSKKHEQNVENIIKKKGFKKSKDKNNKLDKCTYISQPNGSQKPPDFKVFDGKNYIDIECKSKKLGYKPMWNSTIPNKNTFYLFTNQKDNKTLIIQGKQIITNNLEKILKKYKSENKDLQHKYNKLLSNLPLHTNPYKIGVYARNMFVQNKHFLH